MIRFVALFFLFAVSALAQSDSAAIEARLIPVPTVVVSGTAVQFVLRVEVVADAELDVAVLNGRYLRVKEPSSDGIDFGALAGHSVPVAAGTILERRFEAVLPVESDSGMKRVSVSWPGLPGAVASVEIAPRQDGLEVDTLDLERTKVLLMTSMGRMTIEFLDVAPNHARNFIELSKSGFYDGTRFHRVVRGQIVQGGCPNTKEGATGRPGTGGPGHSVDAEFSSLRHVRGAVSMARGDDVNSAGSQFFLCHGDVSSLDGRYSVFGRIDSGLNTLDKIAEVPVHDVRGTPTPVAPVYLHRAIVLPVLKEEEKGSK